MNWISLTLNTGRTVFVTESPGGGESDGVEFEVEQVRGFGYNLVWCYLLIKHNKYGEEFTHGEVSWALVARADTAEPSNVQTQKPAKSHEALQETWGDQTIYQKGNLIKRPISVQRLTKEMSRWNRQMRHWLALFVEDGLPAGRCHCAAEHFGPVWLPNRHTAIRMTDFFKEN